MANYGPEANLRNILLSKTWDHIKNGIIKYDCLQFTLKLTLIMVNYIMNSLYSCSPSSGRDVVCLFAKCSA